MWLTSILVLVAISYPVAASVSADCNEIENRKMHLSVYASNLSNALTTRTTDGGPYKPKRVQRCAQGKCETSEDAVFKLVYWPSHPDADSDGYVKYPNVDPKAELIGFETTFAELVTLAGKKTCALELTTVDGAFLIKYPQGEVRSDFLVHSFDQKRQTIWRRTLIDGTGHNILLNENL